MKKCIIFVLFVLLTIVFVNTGSAENIESMDFESLSELKTKIDAEYLSRQEAKPTTITPGSYEVGKEILPGRYYFAMVEPNDEHSHGWVYVYSSRKKEEWTDKMISIGDEPISFMLERGNLLVITDVKMIMSAAPFNAPDYYQYDVPEGTYVPRGDYIIGEEIPAGEYYVYAAGIPEGYLIIYYSETAYKEDKYKLHSDEYYEIPAEKTPYYKTIKLQEGYVFRVIDDVIMKKRDKFVFE